MVDMRNPAPGKREAASGNSDINSTPKQPDTDTNIPQVPQWWSKREVLKHVWRAATCRGASPKATLAMVILQVIAATPPTVVLPPLLGGKASLNTMLALVGKSGLGKGVAAAVARDAVIIHDHAGFEVVIPSEPLGSGEGIAQQFCDEDQPKRAIFSTTEIGTVGAVKSRVGSTLMPTLRAAWSGEELGARNAATTTTRRVPAHSYRCCVWFGVQPNLAHILRGDEESAGGTPQRIIWLPAGVDNPDWHMLGKDWPGTFTVTLPKFDTRAGNVIKVPDTLKTDVFATWERVQKSGMFPTAHDESTHQLLVREKLAAGLAIMDGRLEISDDDWQLAADIVQWSNDTLRQIDAFTRAGEVDEATEEQRKYVKAVQAAFRMLAKQIDISLLYWCTYGELAQKLNYKHRGGLDEALLVAEQVGMLVCEEIPDKERHGASRYRYTAAEYPGAKKVLTDLSEKTNWDKYRPQVGVPGAP